MPSVQKTCFDCNTDVASKKRVKDTEGNYYCQPCFDARRAGKKPPARAPQPASVAAAADPYDFPPDPVQPLDTGDIGLAEEPQHLAPEPMAADMFGCADCKKIVNSRQIRNDDGDFICAQCFASRRAKRPAPNAQPRKSFAEEAGISTEPGFTDTILGGILISAVLAIVGFAAHLGLLISFPEKHVETVLLFSIITAAMMTVLLVVQAAALVGSMFITARILGGCDFGSLGNALWKSTAVVLGLHVINYFMPHIGFYGLGLRGLILVVTFMAVFRLDAFEAVLLAVINFFMFLGLAIAMGLAILSASHSFHTGAHDLDDNPPAVHQAPDLKPLAPDNPQPAPAN